MQNPEEAIEQLKRDLLFSQTMLSILITTLIDQGVLSGPSLSKAFRHGVERYLGNAETLRNQGKSLSDAHLEQLLKYANWFENLRSKENGQEVGS